MTCCMQPKCLITYVLMSICICKKLTYKPTILNLNNKGFHLKFAAQNSNVELEFEELTKIKALIC